MRLLADENIPRSIVTALGAAGHEVIWACTQFAGWRDTALLDFAETEGLIVLTLDKDFWQIAIQRRSPLQRAGVVLFRGHPATPANLEPLVALFLNAGATWAGHLSVISREGTQMVAAKPLS